MADVESKLSLREAALSYAAQGLYVFPCSENSKAPATAHGFQDATTDPKQIEQWWNINPNFNIGVAPARSRHCVLDADPPRGMDTLAALELEHGLLPPTWAVRTPRGGFHFWFEGSLRPTQGDTNGLGPNVDTRGEGSYVLLPPSHVIDHKKGINGAYTAEKISDIAVAPPWIEKLLGAPHERHRGSDCELDAVANVMRATELLRAYCASGNVAIEGQGGDSRTYQVAAEIQNLGLTPEKAYELLSTEWNPHCVPPWPEDELAQKCVNAGAYAQNDPGAWATAPAAETFSPALILEAQAEYSAGAAEGLPPSPVKNISRFYPQDESEQDQEPDPTWLLPEILPAEATAVLYGPPDSYKSFLALDIGLTLASGRAAYGTPRRPPVAVVYVAAERAKDMKRKRRPAWRLANGIESALPFYIVNTMPRVARPEDFLELIEEIKKRKIKPGLIILDTAARAMLGLNENDARDSGQLVECLEGLARAFGCTVLTIHHTGKDNDRGMRGSNALAGGVDAAFEAVSHRDSRTVALHCRRQKDADRRETPWLFQGRPVGGSLVFYEIDTATHAKAIRADDAYAPAKIGAALRGLGAVGADRAITTHVLATHILPPLESDTEETKSRLISVAVKTLRRLSQTTLAGYTVLGAKELTWCLPG